MNKTTGIIMIVIGLLILAAVVLAAPLHLAGSSYGIKKISGLVIGAIILIVGLFSAMANNRKTS
jgi:hypothetical protein